MRVGLLAAASLAVGLAFAATPANAVVTIDNSQVGTPIVVNYNGFTNPDGAMGTLAGLSASTTFTLLSIVGSTFNFSYLVDNTSSGPVTSSRVSIFGFDALPGAIAASATNEFNQTALGGNVPNLTGVDSNRVCFRAGGGGNNCAGGGGGGVTILEANSTGNFALTFAPGTTSVDLDRFFVRYQDVMTSASRDTSATGLGTPVPVIPEPSTWIMMLLGFGLVGGVLRARRRSATPAFV